jgi:pyruvate,water dikinase
LSGKDSQAVRCLPDRQAMYERYKALPPYPSIIRGYFEPFKWAEDPERPDNIYDAQTGVQVEPVEDSRMIKGSPGAAGRVEGRVRRLDDPGQGGNLQLGEVLVTAQTNIGWTPIFPRAGAIITDIGATFSHAAIVARELGVPAVVGCGDATRRLKTGDYVRVDGGLGLVEILESGVGEE